MAKNNPRTLSKRLRIETLEARRLLSSNELDPTIGDAPSEPLIVAVDDRFKLERETGVATLNVLSNDMRPYSSYGSPRIVSLGTQRRDDAQAVISRDGKSIYYHTPSAAYYRDRFTYTTEYRVGGESFFRTATIHVETGSNPGLADVEATSRRPKQFQLVLGEADFEGLDLHINTGYFESSQILAISQPSRGGSVSIAPDGYLQYHPLPDAQGSEVFSYIVRTNRTGEREKFFVNVELLSPYELTPTLSGSSFAIDAGTSAQVLRPDLGEPTTDWFIADPQIVDIEIPAHAGEISIREDGTSLLYEPAPEFLGKFMANYTVRFGNLPHQTVEGTLLVSVAQRFQAIDDYFFVAGDSIANQLDPLANDLTFEHSLPLVGTAQYPSQDLQLQIGYVYRGNQGGTMEITAEKQAVLYTPRTGFRGDETFRYLYRDNFRGARSTASIVVTVGEPNTVATAASSDSLTHFSSPAELQQQLIEAAVTQHRHDFGQTEFKPPLRNQFSVLNCSRHSSVTVVFGDPYNYQIPRNFEEYASSSEGVQLSQSFQADENYVYTISDGQLVIVDNSDPADPQPISFTPLVDPSLHLQTLITADPFIEVFLHEDRLTLVKNTWDPEVLPAVVSIYDVSDRTSPQLLERTEIIGTILESRQVEGRLLLTLERKLEVPDLSYETIDTLEPLRKHDSEGCLNTSSADIHNVYVPGEANPELIRYETYDKYLTRVRETLISDTLASFATYNGTGELVRSGYFNTVDQIYELDGYASRIKTVALFDMQGGEQGPAAAQSFYSNDVRFYVSAEAIYAIDSDGSQTEIHHFTHEADGALAPVAHGTVPGSILRHLSVDASDGFLRIATTSPAAQSDTSSVPLHYGNHLTVLQQEGTALTPVGSLSNFLPEETLYSVRYDGDFAYGTTKYENTPILLFDLSDPASPKLESSIEIPDFQNYLQPIGANHLLALGKYDVSYPGHPRLTLIDISDRSNPVVVHEETFLHSFLLDEYHSNLEAYHYYADHNLFLLPVQGTFAVGFDTDNDGELDDTEYRLGTGWIAVEISLAGDEAEAAPLEVVDRAQFYGDRVHVQRLGDVLLTVGQQALFVHDVSAINDESTHIYLGNLAFDDRFTIAEEAGQQSFNVTLNDGFDSESSVVQIAAVTQPRAMYEPAIRYISTLPVHWFTLYTDENPGTATISEDGTQVVFTPAPDFHGTAVFEYTVNDPLRGEQTASVVVEVENAPDMPTLVDDTYIVPPNTSAATFSVLDNDSDPDSRTLGVPHLRPDLQDNQALSDWARSYFYHPGRSGRVEHAITAVGETDKGGMVAIGSDGKTLSYTPASDFVGEETFTYTVTDFDGLTSEATVRVVVEEEELPPGLDTLDHAEPVFYGPLPPAYDAAFAQIGE